MGNLEKLSTLHPQNEPDVDLYPNIKLENIPQEAFDNEATEGSLKLVNSDLLYRSLIRKQDVLEFDNEPTQDSTKMVNSGGIYNYIQNLDIYQRTLSLGNLILIDDNNTISVDESKVVVDSNIVLGTDNVLEQLGTSIPTGNYILGKENKIAKDSVDNWVASTSMMIGYKNQTLSTNYYSILLGQENFSHFAQYSLALGYKNSIGNRWGGSLDENLIAIGNNNKVGDISSRYCHHIIGIGNNIENQDNYTFVIDTNANGTYGSTRSALVGNLQGLYYNGAKMATEEQVDTKLTKVTGATTVMQAYVKLDNGTNQMLDVHWNNIRDTIPIRDQTGNIRVATTPTVNTHATSKQYVDGLVTVKSMTYSALATLKSNNGLVAGTYYRITDYVTKVNGKVNNVNGVARSAEHSFDVIILATSNNTFSEEASAILHSGDTYFANSDLKAWKLWYCFDNDTNRFEWADTTNGKGVIYRMIDEFENDLPYDFKNVQFKRYKITSTTDSRQSGLIGMYLGFEGNYGVVSDTADYKWYYTFTKSSDDSELSYVAYNNTAYNNGHYVKQVKIGQYLCDSPNYRGVQALNNIVFITPYTIVDMQIGVNSFNDTLVGNEDITYSYYGEMFRRNIILGDQSHNRVDECMEDNILGNGTLSNDIQWNKIANHFTKNFAIILRSNTIGCNAKETKYPGEFSYNAVNISIQNSDFSNMSSILRSTISLITNSTLSGNGIQESTFGSLKHVTMNVNVLLGCRFQFLQYATFTQGSSTINIMNLTVGAIYGTSSDIYNIPLSDLPNISGNRFVKSIGWDRGDTSNPFILTYTYNSIDESNLGFETSKYAYINGAWTEITTFLTDAEIETLISEVF